VAIVILLVAIIFILLVVVAVVLALQLGFALRARKKRGNQALGQNGLG
jgi:heme/copper-type cytochrome/quinol oxidase subunit 2